MPHDVLTGTTVAGWLERLLGSGALAPPRYGLRLHLRDGREIDDWAVGSFTLDERLHAPYALTVVAVTHETEVDLEGLLGGRVTLEIDRGEQRRAVHGVVLEAERVDGRGDIRVELRVVPALALLGLLRRSRVFQGVSAVEIAMTVLEPVLAEHGGALCVDQLTRLYQPRDLCVQYRETDLDFLLRILAAEGITVVFDHGLGIETVVLVDDSAALPVAGREPLEACDEPPPIVPFVAEREDELPIESIQAVARRTCMGEQASATWLCASSNATALRAGSVLELLTAPDEEHGETWVVTAVRHQGDTAAGPQYGNEIECQPLREPVVPPRIPKPQVVGMCSAIVTGPPGEAIHTDRFGRVRVRMLWDEQEPSSCWLRVASPWAGDGFGAVFMPRVGTEVIVSFVDGDPDRPFCSACVHGDAARPPYALPEHAARTVLRTRTLGGEGHSELSFDDTAGSEEVLLHAHRNLREEILAHHATEVGRNQTLRVDGSRHARIGKDDTTTTAGEHRHTVSGQVTERYRSGYLLRVGEQPKDPSRPQGLSIEVARGGYELAAVESIVLRCGNSRLELHPDRIVLRSPRIEAKSPKASLVLDGDAVTIRADKKLELGADVLAAVSTSMTVIKGPTCEIGGVTVDIEGERISVEASARIDIATPGEVDIRGAEMIKLN
jgi:type VI secretion system secreted protein VgrG